MKYEIKLIFSQVQKIPNLAYQIYQTLQIYWYMKSSFRPSLKYKKYLIWPIKYIKHYKSTEYMKRTILSINMIGNEKQKTWQKNTIFTSKMLKGLCRC